MHEKFSFLEQTKENVMKENVLEEVSMQTEIKEGLEVMKGSGNRYAWIMSDVISENKEPKNEMLAELLLNQKHELPELISCVMERACNLQCAHCLYQEEKSSAKISREHSLSDRIVDIVSQMPERSNSEEEGYNPQFISIGRILRPEHLETFTRLRTLRPDVKLGVIDNGSFTTLLPKWPTDFKFDWIDVSVDGLEDSHNKQRLSPKAFAQAIEGLKQAREVTKSPEEGGRVTSLLTLTKINAKDIAGVADMLLSAEGENLPLADQFCVTTVGPTNEVNRKLETELDDFLTAWEQIKEISHKYNTEENERFRFSIYRIQDIEKLAAVVGEKHFLEQFTANENDALPVKAGRNFLNFEFDGVKVLYQPLSIWIPEEFPIDADGVYRGAYMVKYTLEELQSGVAKDGSDTTPYTFETITPETDFRECFERAVDSYWINFGKQRLEEEIAVFRRIREKAMSN